MVGFHVVGADMLGNTTGLTGSHLGATDVIQQGGLAVVNVAHNTHHRSPAGLLAAAIAGDLADHLFLKGVLAHGPGLVAQFLGDQYRRFLVRAWLIVAITPIPIRVLITSAALTAMR